jgi:hypothetical protein
MAPLLPPHVHRGTHVSPAQLAPFSLAMLLFKLSYRLKAARLDAIGPAVVCKLINMATGSSWQPAFCKHGTHGVSEAPQTFTTLLILLLMVLHRFFDAWLLMAGAVSVLPLPLVPLLVCIPSRACCRLARPHL